MTYNEKKKLFGNAVLEALKGKYEQELASCEAEPEISEAHTNAMEKIIRDHRTADRRKKKRRLVALLIAALLLLAGCTVYVYRDEIKKFNLHIFDTHISLDFNDGQTEQMRTIEDVYVLTYVPEGYEKISESIDDIGVWYVWQNENNELIIFDQHLLDGAIFGVDTERSEIIPVEGYENTVFHSVTGTMHCYIWNDGKYAMKLEISRDHEIEEIRAIIMGIMAK